MIEWIFVFHTSILILTINFQNGAVGLSIIVSRSVMKYRKELFPFPHFKNAHSFLEHEFLFYTLYMFFKGHYWRVKAHDLATWQNEQYTWRNQEGKIRWAGVSVLQHCLSSVCFYILNSKAFVNDLNLK